MAIIAKHDGDVTVATIAVRNAIPKKFDCMQVMVLDASGDASLGAGQALYQYSSVLSSWVLLWASALELTELDSRLSALEGYSDPYKIDLIVDSGGTVTSPTDNRLRITAKDAGGRTLPEVIGMDGDRLTFQESLAYANVSFWKAVGNVTTATTTGMSLTAAGTGTAASVALTNIHTATKRLEYAVTTASATAVAGLRQATLQYALGDPATAYGGFHFVAVFGPSRGVASDATRRFWAGMTSITAAPTDTQPSTWADNAIGVGADSTDTNWQIMHRAATGTMTKIDTGIAKSAADNSVMFRLSIFSPNRGGQRATVRFENLTTGAVFEHTITTNLPALTQLLAWQIWNSVGGTSSVIGMAISQVYISTPN